MFAPTLSKALVLFQWCAMPANSAFFRLWCAYQLICLCSPRRMQYQQTAASTESHFPSFRPIAPMISPPSQSMTKTAIARGGKQLPPNLSKPLA